MSGTSQFTHKLINATFQLGKGSFGNSGFNTVKLSGLRASASVVEAGGPSMGQLQLRVWGMTLSQMNDLTTVGILPTEQRRNNVVVEAGDAESGMAVVFSGTIKEAWADFESMPDVAFHVTAFAGLEGALAPVRPTSIRGSADVATIMKGLATQMGMTFENNNVNVKLADPYFPGTARDQVQRCAYAAGINFLITNNTLCIWNRGQSRGTQIPLIGPSSGMVLYPTYTATGLVVKIFYNKSVNFGGTVQIQSSLQKACGKWVIYSLAHNLDSEVPGGNWFTQFECAPPGYAPVK